MAADCWCIKLAHLVVLLIVLIQVVEDQKHTKKKYMDFKNAVWHTSFYQLLASVEAHLKMSYWFKRAESNVVSGP